jgi:hypothetical protein
MNNEGTGKSNLTNNIPMEFNLGNRSLNRSNATRVFNKYYLNVTDDLRIQKANIESTKVSLKEAFSQGFSEIIIIPITEPEVKCTIEVLKINTEMFAMEYLIKLQWQVVTELISPLPTFLICH